MPIDEAFNDHLVWALMDTEPDDVGAYDDMGPEPSCEVAMYSCCVCGDTVARSEWSDASTCCSRHLLPTESLEDKMYDLARTAGYAFLYRSDL